MRVENGEMAVSKLSSLKHRNVFGWHVVGHKGRKPVSHQGAEHERGRDMEDMSTESTGDGHLKQEVSFEGLSEAHTGCDSIAERSKDEWQPAELRRQGNWMEATQSRAESEATSW